MGMRRAPGGCQVRGAMCDARVEIWVFVLRVRVLRCVKGHGNVRLRHSRAGMRDWEETDTSKSPSVSRFCTAVDCMNFASQGQIRQMGTGAFKRASDVAGGIGRVFYRIPGGKQQKQMGVGKMY